MVPATTKMIIPVAIVVMVPVSTVCVVIRCVITRCIREGFDDCNAGKANSNTDVRMGLGGHALSDAGNPQSST
jgi:hypothetical protein